MKPLYLSDAEANREANDKILEGLLTLNWLQATTARKEYFMSDRPRSYAYKTFEGMRSYDSSPYSESIEKIRQVLNRDGGQYNVCFLNRYDEQNNFLGWHADDSPEMDHDHGIAVVSYGAEREIWWKPKDYKGTIPPEWRQKLEHGSTFIMPPGFQREYLHRIPKCDRACGVRVSLTFRHYIGD